MPGGRGVGPSAVNQLFRDRSLRLATLLAVGIGIPVAILFYFQFRSLSDLSQASSVVLRQMSLETADAVTKELQDSLHAPRTDVLLKIFQYQTEPLDLPFIQTTFNQGLDSDPFVDGFYVWSDATVEHRNELLSFDRNTRSFVASPPETGLVLGQFRAMAPAQRAIAVFEAPLNGRERKLLGQANRNGFYYVLDRETGAFVTGVPYANQTWSDGLDAKGRPIRKKGIAPSPEGTLVFPNIQGAANWHSPTYSPQTKLFYQHAREMGTIYYKGDAVYKPGTAFTGGGGRYVNGDDASSAIRALDATTGKMKWEFPLLSPGFSSLLSTAGGLVFSGTEEGNFIALDAETGKSLWDIQLGGPVRGMPISYAVDGKQFVAIPAGTTLFVFGL